jgi:beta-lactamase class A
MTTSSGETIQNRGGRAAFQLFFASLACLAAVFAASPAEQNLKNEINSVRQKFPGEMAVYMKNLASGEELALDADRVGETYSVIKIPVMVEVLRRVERGDFSLSDRIEFKSSDRRLGSGLLSKLDPGLQPTLKDLLTLMIIVSDNSATDVLAGKVGRANVTRTMHELGLKNTSIKFSVLDDYREWFAYMDPTLHPKTAEEIFNFPVHKYSEAQVDAASRMLDDDPHIYFGHSTPREIGWLLEKMVKGTLVSKSASALMLEILKKQQVNDRFPRYLRNVTIAHKTGDDQPYLANDAGVLWVKDQPIVLVVFTAHHRGSTSALHDAIARVAAYTARHYGGDLTPDFTP